MGALEGELPGNGCKLFNCSSVLLRSCWDEVSFKVLDLITIGLCFGAFLPLTVLLLVGTLSSAGPVTVIDTVLWFASAVSIVFAGSAYFLPNNDPNSLLF